MLEKGGRLINPRFSPASYKEEEERLQLERQGLIKENRKVQEKLDRFDKLLDDFVLVN